MSAKPRTINFDLSERQGLAMAATDQFVLYGGAKGGGKSWFLNVWLFTQASQNLGSKWFAFRKRGVDFTNTTLETWKKAIPADMYTINPTLKKIYVPISNSTIDYGGLDDELAVEKLNSAEYSGGIIDQAEEIEKTSFSMCRGTLRHKREICSTHPDNSCDVTCDGRSYPYQVRMSANPRQCWLKNDFILTKKRGHLFVPALPTDNPYLPKDYVQNLREAFSHRPELLKAYLEGSWDEVAGSNVCISNFDIQRNKSKKMFGPVTKRIVVNDPARFGDDENVIYLMEERDGVAYVAKEEILLHKSTSDTAARLAVMRNKYDATDIFVDSIGVGAGVVDTLRDMNEPVSEISSSRKATIETENRKYANLRSQIWMEAGRKFSEGLAKTHDEVLDGQLSSITFDYKTNGVVQVEGKTDIKKRLGQSPDRADTFIMGLHGLSQVREIPEIEYAHASVDRAGHGIPVNQDLNEYTQFPDDCIV